MRIAVRLWANWRGPFTLLEAAARATHENHEGDFMMMALPQSRRFREHGCGYSRSLTVGGIMKWETPRAVDLRFGMEITMYISRR
jgi:coenzyme PQQ precursor peptide PqqA